MPVSEEMPMTDAPASAAPIRFVDLQAQRARIGPRLDEALARVLAHGQFIMGPEVGALEDELADFCGARHVLSCANGTDALVLALAALGVRSGDAVLVPAFTFAATAEVVPWLGAVPVFVDVLADSFNMDPASLERGIATAEAAGLRPVGVIPVDLFGQPADYDALTPIAEAHGLWVVADAAQSFGANYRGKKVGTIGRIATTSFFPSKPLGCYGDGGAVFTDDDELAAIMRSLRVHGEGKDKYDNVRIGMNARLDTLQAAVLREKLRIFPEEIVARDALAKAYDAAFADLARTPRPIEGVTSVWAQYTLVLEGRDRDRVAAELKAAGVPSAIYYTKPLHLQTAYRGYPVEGGRLPVSEALASKVLSLPMHAHMDRATRVRVVDAVRRVLDGR